MEGRRPDGIKKMYETAYHLAGNLQEAATLFADASEARYLAGGQTLIPTMKQRLAAPSDLIDISRLAELKGIAASGEVVTIGAATTHAEVERSDAVRRAHSGARRPRRPDRRSGGPPPRARSAARSPTTIRRPTIPPRRSASARPSTPTSARSPPTHFFTGLFATALDDGEIITKVAFPVPAKAAYEKFQHPASRYAMAGVFVARMKDNAHPRRRDRRRQSAASSAPATSRRLLADFFLPSAIDAVTIDPGGMLSDIHGSAAYRANLVKVMARRAVKSLG